MTEAGSRELIIVVTTMAVLFLFAIAVVAIFFRIWRKERRPPR